MREINKQTYEDRFNKMKDYDKTIISVWFASFFAVLLLSRKYISPKSMCIIAICTLISLSIYLLWTIYNMITNAISIMGNTPQNYNKKSIIIWVLALILTIGPMTIGSVILIFELLKYII